MPRVMGSLAIVGMMVGLMIGRLTTPEPVELQQVETARDGVVVWFNGERGTEKLLILSQVILSLQLSFAVIPLVMFTGDRAKMGEFVNARWLKVLAWSTAVLIAGLNGWLLVLMARGSV